MNKWWGILNALLAGTLVLLVLLLVAMRTNPARRNGYWLEGMVDTPAAQDYAANPYFPNGQTLQTPPDGTLAQGQRDYPYAGGFDGAMAAGKALKNPLNPDDPAVLKRGHILFERDCMPCHGVAGRGDGLVTATKRPGGFPPPPSLLADHARGLPDGYIYNYISRGGILMPSYGAQIAPMQRWKVVSWVRHMQKTFPENPPVAGSPQAALEARLVPETTPGYGYTGKPLDNEILYQESLAQAVEDNRGNPSPAEAQPTPTPMSDAAEDAAEDAAATPWGKALVLIHKNDCFSCHAVDHKVVGPAYMDVAKRYYGMKGIVPILVKKVKLGGSGNWGQIPMAAHPNTSDADLTIIVKGILSLANKKTSMAPSLKKVLEMVHSGVPIHCPALEGQAINGPAYLGGGGVQASVRRVSAPVVLASAGKESKP